MKIMTQFLFSTVPDFNASLERAQSQLIFLPLATIDGTPQFSFTVSLEVLVIDNISALDVLSVTDLACRWKKPPSNLITLVL